MQHFKIRKALPDESPVVTNFIRLMLEEMASMGGHDVIGGNRKWKRIEGVVAKKILDKDCLYLFACTEGDESAPIGFIEAQAVFPGDIFKLKRTLHIRSIYVYNTYRRKGIARALLKAALKWGQKSKCAEADLNTLAGNPARFLYEDLGFSIFEFRMSRIL